MGKAKGRPMKKPGYNAQEIMQSLMDALAETYIEQVKQSDGSMRKIAQEFGMSPLKVRKLLITAGVFSSDISDWVNQLYAEGKTVSMIQEITGLSRASVHSYLPYTKMIYKAEELSTNAERIQIYRDRRNRLDAFADRLSMWEAGLVPKDSLRQELWELIGVYAGFPFYTVKELRFSYTVKGYEIFINRKDKSITKSSVDIALDKALEFHGIVKGPKKLKIFGASYIYPMFLKFGIIRG